MFSSITYAHRGKNRVPSGSFKALKMRGGVPFAPGAAETDTQARIFY
ncbi:hypothetical protein [Treponema endosymbiont of Eucomonympha sp.]|nr:hypothetical protein [Treponema endosymbiont of Eucomonympha sp.]